MSESASIRRTKIVATLGPAWAQPEQMNALFDAGVNVVRVNASHGSPEVRREWITTAKEVRAARREAIGLVLDLQGPRIRVGQLPQPIRLLPGHQVVFAPEAVVTSGEIPTTYDAIARDVFPGARILLDDGLLAVRVQDVQGERVIATVEYGGELRSNKGMNLPGIEVSA
ncbi:MAG TPA: pyruvate kinase, partial [Gemmatimonadales bacterium]|nr:pyruvate kinase [Gemmatimonadales bacterium]